jgi:hypothetical protein
MTADCCGPHRRLKDCEDEEVKTLFHLLEKRVRYAAVDSAEMFDAGSYSNLISNGPSE